MAPWMPADLVPQLRAVWPRALPAEKAPERSKPFREVRRPWPLLRPSAPPLMAICAALPSRPIEERLLRLSPRLPWADIPPAATDLTCGAEAVDLIMLGAWGR
ncbi:hypothetical protein D3C72_2048310 [compost metagenome]